jgi:hypothetical protein
MSANISNCRVELPIFKQGDDMQRCIIIDSNGKINVHASIQNYINLLTHASIILQQIHDTIPITNDITIDANTHFIGLVGDRNVIDQLVLQNLCSIDDFNDEYSDNELVTEQNSMYLSDDMHN